jgi:site-specific DNA-cytosine methylase
MSETDKYQALNRLALRSIDLVLEAWATPPAIILLENVPRMLTRGADLLNRIKSTLRAAGYEVDLRTHDCGELGGLAQKRERVLLVARHRELAPSPMLVPPSQALKPMSAVLWQLPVPTPGSDLGGPMHRLPKLAAINWLRLACIRAGNDWRDIPARVRMGGDPRLPSDSKRHAGKYGVQNAGKPSHTVLADLRTGKGWADVADPRLAPRSSRQNGGFGVNDQHRPAHSVLGEGSVRNTFAAVTDPRLGCSPHGGTMGVASSDRHSVTVIGSADIHNSTAAIADPRSECTRREGSLGVSYPGLPYMTSVIGNAQIHNNPTSIADPRLEYSPRRGTYGVQDPARSSKAIRGEHSIRQAPASVADGRLFNPSHRLIVGQFLDVSREAWTTGEFELRGSALAVTKGGSPIHVIIEAPDGTVHRPLTTLELAVLQGLPAWHIPGCADDVAIGADGGQWLDLEGGKDAGKRERIGNAVPVQTAQAFGEVALEVLDAGAEETFRLSAGGLWVQQGERAVISLSDVARTK